MYSKDELSVKSREELADIAKTLELNPDEYDKQEDLVYAILDRQAEVEGTISQIHINKNVAGFILQHFYLYVFTEILLSPLTKKTIS